MSRKVLKKRYYEDEDEDTEEEEEEEDAKCLPQQDDDDEKEEEKKIKGVVATDRDVELGNEEAAQVHPGSAEGQKVVVEQGVSHRRRQWQLVGAVLLVIITVLVIVLSITLSNEPLSLQDLSNLLSSVSSDGGEALRTNSTPQNMAFNWLATNNTNLGAYTNAIIIQRYALATLYFSTNGDHWSSRYFWVSNEDVCSSPWYGVTCTYTGAFAFFFDPLTFLDLSWNLLSGTIPPEIGLLPVLEYLWLEDNVLNGTIPTEIRQLTQLKWLRLHNNTLTGTIPSEIGLLSDLEDLRLYENTLNGTIPTEIAQLKQLNLIELYSNKLTGTIPSEINSLTNLWSLDLSNNNLTGTIPSEINSLTNLDTLILYANMLTGSYTCPGFINGCLISCDDYDNLACRSLG